MKEPRFMNEYHRHVLNVIYDSGMTAATIEALMKRANFILCDYTHGVIACYDAMRQLAMIEEIVTNTKKA